MRRQRATVQWRHLVNWHEAARCCEWAQHFSNASCLYEAIVRLIWFTRVGEGWACTDTYRGNSRTCWRRMGRYKLIMDTLSVTLAHTATDGRPVAYQSSSGNTKLTVAVIAVGLQYLCIGLSKLLRTFQSNIYNTIKARSFFLEITVY